MASVHDFRSIAEERYQELRQLCRACFAATPFDGNRYVALCEQRRRARLRLERINAMYERVPAAPPQPAAAELATQDALVRR